MLVLDKRVEELSEVFSQEELKGVLNKVLDEVMERLGLLFVEAGEWEKLEDLLNGNSDSKEFLRIWRDAACGLMYGSVSSLAMMLARGILFKEWDKDVLKEMAGVLYLLSMVLIEWEMGEDVLDVVRWLKNTLSGAVVVDESKVEISGQEIEDLMKKEVGKVVASEL
jgi:hypothetical protein